MDSKAFYRLTYGLFLLSAKDAQGDNGCIINTAMQVANDPARISIAVIKANHTCEMIQNTGLFNVSCLTEKAPFDLFKRFGMQSGRNTDKFADFGSVARTANGLLRLTEYANAYFSAKVTESHDLGSHMLFVGEATDAETLGADPSCTYGYYQRAIKPRPTAPATGKKAWICSVCGYVYEGDEIPEDYSCPLCHHGKEDFVLQGIETQAVKPVETVSPKSTSATKWVCSVCGYVYEGETLPEDFRCPQCNVLASKFNKQEADMSWAAEHVVGAAKDCPEEILEGLRANFTGECTEVGMYLAMARAAYREGYPEVGLYWEKAAFEEAEHAAKFAELLGEVVTDSTKKNLQLRVDAEYGATAGKTELANKAEALGFDAIHDTVHEMARDEARHGKALKGLLERYFK